jgi:argininosuccinate synthase
VKVQYRPGNAFVAGVTSPYSIMAASKGVYGEAAGEWTAADALGFSKMVGLPGMFWTRAGQKTSQG